MASPISVCWVTKKLDDRVIAFPTRHRERDNDDIWRIMVKIITMDTNVLVAALISNLGASHYILRLILEEKIKLALTPAVYFEYYDVLTRKEILAKTHLSIEEVENILDLLALLAKKHAVYFLLRPNLFDEKDNLICECAFASQSNYLMTSNIKDFISGELKAFRFQVITPKDFCQLWRLHDE